jgi:hypothetical protein
MSEIPISNGWDFFYTINIRGREACAAILRQVQEGEQNPNQQWLGFFLYYQHSWTRSLCRYFCDKSQKMSEIPTSNGWDFLIHWTL